MENQTFKLSKTGIIIIVIITVIVILFGIVIYIARKKQQEINKQQAEDKTEIEIEPEPEKVNAIGEDVVDDEKYHQIFDDYRAGKYNSKEAIKTSGLSTGMFYKKLNKYENK
jgi:flagellar basal body-associated protein FliL